MHKKNQNPQRGNMQQILKRLELIKTAITIEDEEIIELQVLKLQGLETDAQVQSILQKLEGLAYASALVEMEAYIKQYSRVVSYEDPEVKGLKLELKVLEQKLQDLDALKAEQLNTIEEFNTQYSLRVGDVVEKILKRKEELLAQSLAFMQAMYEAEQARYEDARHKAKTLEDELEELTPFDDAYDDLYEAWQEAKEEEITQREKTEEAKEALEEDEAFQEYEDLKEEYEEFHKEYEEVLNKTQHNLSDEEKKELKKLFRKAARLCHPDIVTKELQDQAHEITAQLNEAYAQKDLTKVKKILQMLENGVYFDIASDTLENKEKLKNKIAQLREKVTAINEELQAIKEDETFNTIEEIEDWDAYFAQLREALEMEYQNLLETEKPTEHKTVQDEDEQYWDELF